MIERITRRHGRRYPRARRARAAGSRAALAALLGLIGLVPAAAYAQFPSNEVPATQDRFGVAPEGFDLEKGDIEGAANRTAYAPGDRANLSVRLTIEDGWHTNSHEPTLEFLIATTVTFDPVPGWPAASDPTYPPGEMKSFSFTEFPISVYEGVVHMRTELPIPADAAPGTVPVRATVVYQACDDKMCLAPVTAETTIGITVGTRGELVNADFFGQDIIRRGGSSPGGGRGFLGFLLLAFLGGLILNAMPCVLPVLSIKVFGLVKSAEGGRGAIAAGSLATAVGIVLSFLLLATAAVVARSAGAAVGWGIQFQEPVFVASLAIVVLLFALNLWGMFEIPLPAFLGRVGASGPSEGLAGHLTTGFFATLMATPCSAPFLGTALGFALTQPGPTTYATFGTIGLGMASPYLVLAAFPGFGRALPKPGPWMNTFRVVMGFLLAATLVWLLYVLSSLISAERLAFFEVGLLGIALLVWLATRAGAGSATKRVAGAAALLAVLASAAYAARGSGDAPGVSIGVAPEDRLIAWEPFDRDRAEAEAANGRYVFVDVTADWCFTCKVNEGLFLETEDVASAFERHDVLALRADWTRRDEAIGRYLADFGRYGIPFYVMYRPGREPYVLSELLSKSAILELLSE